MSEIDDIMKPVKRKPAINIIFEDNTDLYDAMNKYRINMGWTWKRLLLVGLANTLKDENPDIVIAIADYLEARR